MENHNHSQDAGAEPMLLSVCGAGAEVETASLTSTGAESTSRKTSSPEAALKKREKAQKKTDDKTMSLILAHGRIEKTNHPEAANGSYFSLPSGRVLVASVVNRLIASGRLVSCNDGLFDDSQTYEPST